MDWDLIDWDAIDRLRQGFLSGQAGLRDYWLNESDLHTYDQTFAQRIAWKWQYVLDDLRRLPWSPPEGLTLDWGCGTGIAGRTFAKRYSCVAGVSPASGRGMGVPPMRPEGVSPSVLQDEDHSHDSPITHNKDHGQDAHETHGRDAHATQDAHATKSATLALYDRSAMAMDFAVAVARAEMPGAQVVAGLGDEPPATLLLSHVLSELADRQLSALLELASRATAVIWVEPGTHEISRRLIAVRERLRGQFNMVAPCTHQAVCGMLAGGNERHWCHHFVPAPAFIHTDGNWRKFGILAGIDLRALPLSYLVLDRRPAPVLPEGTRRVIGRPRVYKAYAQLFGCDASGVNDYRLMKRHDADAFRACKKEQSDALQTWQTEGSEILKVV